MRGTKVKFLVEQGNKDNIREHKKTNIRFLGNRGTSLFISGVQQAVPGLLGQKPFQRSIQIPESTIYWKALLITKKH